MQKMSYQEGEQLRQEMNVSIRGFIPLAFDDWEKKVKSFDDDVNWYIAGVGQQKSHKEEQEEYEGRLRDAKIYLMTWKEELEIIDDVSHEKVAKYTATRKVFIVHGHDENAKLQLENLLTRFNLEPVVLHRRPDKGRTIIEKFEAESKDIGYAFVLLTPDDDCLSFDEEIGKRKKVKRPRQNVILELGFFIGSLGRERVCAIYKKGVDIPSDIAGVLYKQFDKSVQELYGEIRKELTTAGYKLPSY